jgi:uncharacterized glyoxalase superfamily protein PhnB
MLMKMEALTPMLRTRHLKESGEFYTTVLGFQCTAWSDTWGWACLQRDNVEVMLALPNAHEPYEQPTFTGSLYFRMTQVEVLWEQVQATATICYPLEDFAYGMREFAIYDNNGYILQFGEVIAACAASQDPPVGDGSDK